MNASTNLNDEKITEPGPVIDPRKARVVREFQQTRAPGYCHFDRSGRFLFVGSEENGIQQWNFETGEKSTLNGHESWVRSFAFPPSGKAFVSSGYDGYLIWWSCESSPPRVASRFQAHRGWIRSIALSPDGRLLASGGNDRIVRVWSMTDQTLVGELTGHQNDI